MSQDIVETLKQGSMKAKSGCVAIVITEKNALKTLKKKGYNNSSKPQDLYERKAKKTLLR